MIKTNNLTSLKVPGSAATGGKPKANAIDRVFFPYTTWALFLLLPLIYFGFRSGYWSKLPGPIDTILHIHTALMMAWVMMALAQPVLILKKKVQWHRRLGKISYVLMPLLLVSGFFLIQHRYDRMLVRINADVAAGKVQFTTEQVYATAATSVRMGLVNFILLTVLYLLAVANRKKFLHHATYMLGAILTALGPAVGRIIPNWYKAQGWKMDFVGFHFSSLLIIGLLAALAIYQKRKGHSLKPVLVTIGCYVAALLTIEFVAKTKAWQAMVELIV